MKVHKPTRNGQESRFFYYDFILDGHRYQGSTKLRDRRKAERLVESLRSKIRLGEVDAETGKPFRIAAVPTFREFSKRFMASVNTRSAQKPATISFYAAKLARLLEFTPLADAPLDKIDEQFIESFVQHRSQAVAAGSVNRELATLRKALRLAHTWKIITRPPKVTLLSGERHCDFVLTDAQERAYLAAAPQPLRDAATLLLDTGLRVGELLALRWQDGSFTNGTRGSIHIRDGKSPNAKRDVGLTTRARAVFEARQAGRTSEYVFTNEAGNAPLSIYTLENQHNRVRKALGLRGMVIHSFRHTVATRLGEAGAEAVEIMRALGHGSLAISQRYAHSTAKMAENAANRLEARNQKALPPAVLGVPAKSL